MEDVIPTPYIFNSTSFLLKNGEVMFISLLKKKAIDQVI
jgi:hypothetical protein